MNMEKNIEVLKSNALFLGINEQDIQSVLTDLSAKEKQYGRDEYIQRAENPITKIGIVISGSANIIKEDYWGNRTIISKLEVGDIFGESLACAGAEKALVSIITCEKCEIIFIEYSNIINISPGTCNYNTQLITNMLKILASKNVMLTQKMEHLAQRKTKEKLLSYLSFQAIKAKNNDFEIPFNRQELADYLSVDRSAMSAELCRLRDEGYLCFKKNKFTLMKLQHK